MESSPLINKLRLAKDNPTEQIKLVMAKVKSTFNIIVEDGDLLYVKCPGDDESDICIYRKAICDGGECLAYTAENDAPLKRVFEEDKIFYERSDIINTTQKVYPVSSVCVLTVPKLGISVWVEHTKNCKNYIRINYKNVCVDGIPYNGSLLDIKIDGLELVWIVMPKIDNEYNPAIIECIDHMRKSFGIPDLRNTTIDVEYQDIIQDIKKFNESFIFLDSKVTIDLESETMKIGNQETKIKVINGKNILNWEVVKSSKTICYYFIICMSKIGNRLSRK